MISVEHFSRNGPLQFQANNIPVGTCGSIFVIEMLLILPAECVVGWK